MDRKLAAVAGLGLVLVVLGILWIAWPDREAGQATSAPGAAAAAAEKPPELVAVQPEAKRLERPAADEPPLQEDAGPAGAVAIVRGRCVRAEDGTPLEACTVTFDGYPRNSAVMATHAAVQWSDPDPLVTGPDGLFEFRFVPPPPYQHGLDVACPGRVPRTARWGAFEPGQVEDLGDVALASGYVVEGRVADTLGAPVAEVGVSLKRLPLPIRDDMAANDTRTARSDATGWFRHDTPIPAGTWSLDVRTRGFKLVEPDRMTVHEGIGTEPLAVVVRRMPSISGVVVDETGAGVPRVGIRAVLRKGSGRMAYGSTRSDGSFTIFAVDDEIPPVRLEIYNPGPCEPPVEPTPEFEWGATDVRIELMRALSFELEVVERESGVPVEDFAVICHAERARSSRYREARLGGHHPSGRVTVDEVWRGTVRLEVLPKDPALVLSEPLVFEALGPPLAPVRIELERMLPRDVVVRSAAGEAVEGSRVELVAVGSMVFDAESWVTDRSQGQMSWSSSPDFRQHDLLAASVTDARGQAQLFAPPDDSGLGLRVLGDSHLPLVVQPVSFPAEGPLELVVGAGGFIAGRVRLAGWSPDSLGLQIEPAGEARTSFGLEPSARLDGDGRFRSSSLAPGAWRLVLYLETRFVKEGSSSGQQLLLEPELATVTVQSGRTTEVDLDASHFAPATVVGRVLLDGAPADAARVFLQRESIQPGGSTWNQGFGHYVPDGAGRFESEPLPPGTYRPGLLVGDFKAGPGTRILAESTFELRAGERLERSFAFEQRRLVLRLLEPDGITPLSETEVEVRIALFGRRVVRTDSEGRVVLDPAPSGELRVLVRTRDLVAGPLTPPAGVRDATLDVVLEPGG